MYDECLRAQSCIAVWKRITEFDETIFTSLWLLMCWLSVLKVTRHWRCVAVVIHSHLCSYKKNKSQQPNALDRNLSLIITFMRLVRHCPVLLVLVLHFIVVLRSPVTRCNPSTVVGGIFMSCVVWHMVSTASSGFDDDIYDVSCENIAKLPVHWCWVHYVADEWNDQTTTVLHLADTAGACPMVTGVNTHRWSNAVTITTTTSSSSVRVSVSPCRVVCRVLQLRRVAWNWIFAAAAAAKLTRKRLICDAVAQPPCLLTDIR